MHDTTDLDPRRLIAPGEDKRTFRRFSPNILAFVRLPAPPALSLADSAAAPDEATFTLQPVPVRDLSMTGLSFFSKLCYPAGADLELCLCLHHVEYRLAGTVKRRQRVDNHLMSYGVDFAQAQTSKKLRVALASFLLRLDADGRRV